MSGERKDQDSQQPEEGRDEETQDGGRGRGRGRSPRAHDPIIIDGGSFAFEFDGGTRRRHYFSATVGSTARYVGLGLRLAGVEIEGASHVCPVPESGLFTVEVEGELGGRREAQLIVRGLPEVVEVEFQIGVFGTPSVTGNRKRCRHPHLRVTGLTIKNILGTVLHTCDDFPPSGRQRIEIRDVHLLGRQRRGGDPAGSVEGL